MAVVTFLSFDIAGQVTNNMAMESNVSSQATAATAPKAAQPRTSFFSSIYADIISTVLTVGAGLAAGSMVINKHFFKNSEKENRFQDIVDARNTALKEKTEGLIGEALKIKTKEIKKTYYNGIRDKLEKMEIGGAIDRFGYLGKHQQAEVLLTVGAVMAGAMIGIGSIIGSQETLTRQKDLKARLDAMDDERDTTPAR